MDQLSAHLDRGWDLAQRGDAQGAGASASKALEVCPESPEAHNLMGYVAALRGDCDDAVEAYLQAIEFDETYVEAMLNAAELFVCPLAEYDQALRLCEQVLNLSEFADERLDAGLLKVESLSLKGDHEQAKAVLARLPAGPYENPAHNYLAGRAMLELGELERADVLLSKSIELEPFNADAQYYYGLLREELGDRRGACRALLRARQLELEMGMPPWAPNGEAFLMFTENAIAQLPEEMREVMMHAELYIADLPGPEMVVDGVDPRSLVLIDAVAVDADVDFDEEGLEQTGPNDNATASADTCVRVFLYALNVLRAAGGLHNVQQHIQDSFQQEIRTVFFPEDEEQLVATDAPAPVASNVAQPSS